MAKRNLETDIKKVIDGLIDKSNEEFDNKNYDLSIILLIEAWNKLPEPKEDYSESYHIVEYLSSTYLDIKEYEKAKEWAAKIFKCALHRQDDGNREFLAGKISFESNDIETAKKYFIDAFNKSEGRCFEDENSKYLKFYKKIVKG
jgi:hypothetical protein